MIRKIPGYIEYNKETDRVTFTPYGGGYSIPIPETSRWKEYEGVDACTLAATKRSGKAHSVSVHSDVYTARKGLKIIKDEWGNNTFAKDTA